MLVISHPTGNQNFRNAAEAFYKANVLAKLYTTVNWKKNNSIAKYLPKGLVAELSRRSYPTISDRLISTYPFFELGRLASKKIGLSNLIRHDSGFFSVDSVYRSLDLHVAKQLKNLQNLSELYCYEDGALESFKAAKQLGVKTIYELPIGYWRAASEILGEEAQLKPEWADTILSSRDSREKLERKDSELLSADKIIVASQFTATTLKISPVSNREVTVIPYGGPKPIEAPNFSRNNKLRVLFVGGLSQRKGVSYLLDAIDILRDKTELTIIGSRMAKCRPLDAVLEKHRYIPSLPHHEILNEMDRHDVFVFPSLFEGFGLVILEAMARGIPVITTPNTAGPDLIDDGIDGYIVPIRSHLSIAEKLEKLVSDGDLLDSLKSNALAKARMFSWLNYQSNLIDAVYGKN